jgi:hypothetical protein
MSASCSGSKNETYDQRIMARCLAQFAETPPRHLELISPGRYPVGGLGQRPAGAPGLRRSLAA